MINIVKKFICPECKHDIEELESYSRNWMKSYYIINKYWDSPYINKNILLDVKMQKFVCPHCGHTEKLIDKFIIEGD